MPDPHGFTLTVRQIDDDNLFVELRFLKTPNKEWVEKAEGILNRMSCARIVELFGDCKSHSPEHVARILEDALANIPQRAQLAQ
jgi:hypothetical protein